MFVDPTKERARQKAERRLKLENPGITNRDFFAILRGELTTNEIADRRKMKVARRALGREQAILERQFAGWSTRELLSEFAMSRKSGEFGEARWWALKKVLDTRPHVMNSQESKARRTRAAKRQHGQGKSKNR